MNDAIDTKVKLAIYRITAETGINGRKNTTVVAALAAASAETNK